MDATPTAKPSDAQASKEKPAAVRKERAVLLRVKTNLEAGTFGGG